MTGGGNQKGSESCNFKKNTLTTVCRFIKKQESLAACNFWKYILTTVCRKIKKILEELKLKPEYQCTFNTASKLSLASCKGAILIEFAICMPILIILLFYISDLVKIKRYYSQTEFVAQQAANMIQNISQKRAAEATTSTEIKRQLRITTNDYWRIARMAALTIYPGLTQRSSSSYPLNHYYGMFIYYVKNNKNGTASCKWISYHYGSYGNFSYCTTGDFSNSSVRYKSNASPSQMHPNLKFNSEDAKIIIEVFLRRYRGDNKTAFGLRLVNPRVLGTYCCFHSVVIITPKPGLFYESLMEDSYASYTDSQVANW